MTVYEILMRKKHFMRELCWAAGFLEGEGCFQGRNTFLVSAAQKEREPLDRLQAIFGGNVYYQVRNNSCDIYNWNAGGIVAASVMMTLWPLMSSRRREAIEIALANWKTKRLSRRSRYATRCQRGHDLSVFGKDAYGTCNECRRIYRRVYYQVNKNRICERDRLRRARATV